MDYPVRFEHYWNPATDNEVWVFYYADGHKREVYDPVEARHLAEHCQ